MEDGHLYTGQAQGFGGRYGTGSTPLVHQQNGLIAGEDRIEMIEMLLILAVGLSLVEPLAQLAEHVHEFGP